VKGEPSSTPGWHRMEGMFAFSGGPFRAVGDAGALHLVDVAPTVLHLSGLPVPKWMQGTPATRLLDEAYVRDHPVRRSDGYPDARDDTSGGDAYTEAQAEQVKDHLRRLGYLE